MGLLLLIIIKAFEISAKSSPYYCSIFNPYISNKNWCYLKGECFVVRSASANIFNALSLVDDFALPTENRKDSEKLGFQRQLKIFPGHL